MKRKISRITVVVLLEMVLLVSVPIASFAHDPSATTSPNKSHIHVRGRVTTPDGVGIAGVNLDFRNPAEIFVGIPSACIYSFGPHATTDSTGSFSYIILINIEPPCRDAFERITIDKTKIEGTKEGYDIRPR